MRKFSLAFAAAAALCAGPALAAEGPPLSNGTEIVNTASTDYLVALLKEMGAAQVEVATAVNGEKVVTFVDGAIPYNVGLTMCEAGKCVGIVFVVAMETGQMQFPLELLNNYNNTNLFSTVARIDATKIGIGRGMLVEAGVTRRNLAVNIGMFVGAVNHTIKYLTTQNVASNEAGKQPFQPVSGQSPLRPVKLSPQEMTTMMKAMTVEKPASDRLKN